MMPLKRIFFSAFLCLLSLVNIRCDGSHGCSSSLDAAKRYEQKEVERIDKSIREITGLLGYGSVSIHINVISNFGRIPVRKKIRDEQAVSGKEQNSPARDEHWPPGYVDSNKDYSYAHRDIVMDFDRESKACYYFEYITALVIVGNPEGAIISSEKLQGILEDSVLNRNRGDRVLVIYRKK